MCLSLPAKVIEIQGDLAEVSIGGTLFKAGLQMIDDVRPGDYILLHAGFAIQKINEDEAQEIMRLFQEMENSFDRT